MHNESEKEALKALKSIRNYSAAQTVLSAGMLFEQEAQRQNLVEQTRLMEEVANRDDNDKLRLSLWRQNVADLEIAVESESAREALEQLVTSETLISEIPKLASLEEITRAKKTLLKKSALLKTTRIEHKEILAQLELVWREKDVDARIKKISSDLDRADQKIGDGDVTNKPALRELLVGVIKEVEIAHLEVEKVEAEFESFERGDRNLIYLLQEQSGHFLYFNPPSVRKGYSDRIKALIEKLPAPEQAVPETPMETGVMRVGNSNVGCLPTLIFICVLGLVVYLVGRLLFG
jgi:hypothetical protein